MKFWNIKKVLILIGILFFFLGNIIILSNSKSDSLTALAGVADISDGWNLECKNFSAINSNLTSAVIGIIHDSETVAVTKTLEDFNITAPCLTFHSTRALVDVFLNGELIYSFGKDYYNSDNSIPQKSHYIKLPDNYAGKTLKIIFTGARNESFSYLTAIYLGPRSELLSLAFRSNNIAITIGTFMFTLGIILIILSPYLFLYHNNDLRILFSGLISLLLGTYILGFYDIFDLIIDNCLVNTIMTNIALYNIPTVILGYLTTTFSGREKKIFSAMFILDVIFFLTSMVLHFAGFNRFSDFTYILQAAAGVEALISIIIIIRAYVISKKSNYTGNMLFADNVFMIGITSFMFFSMIDAFRYNYSRYNHSSWDYSNSLRGFSFGSLVFVSCLMISYLFYNIFSTNIDTMQSRIANIAYTDTLTGLSNRARCEQMMEMLTEEHGRYTIISLDLNKLKHVNDTYGHHEGDRLLMGFSTILSDCFWDANLIGRMGGDEFIVFMLEDRSINAPQRLHELYNLISEWNRKEHLFSYSVSYGYAYSHEVPTGSAKEVYMLADNRMYEMKREHQKDMEVDADA